MNQFEILDMSEQSHSSDTSKKENFEEQSPIKQSVSHSDLQLANEDFSPRSPRSPRSTVPTSTQSQLRQQQDDLKRQVQLLKAQLQEAQSHNTWEQQKQQLILEFENNRIYLQGALFQA